MYKPLFEFIKTNKFYLFLDIELSNLIATNNKTIRKIDKMQIFNHEGYNRYKKYKTNFSGDPRYNYIYQSKVVIKLFNIDDIDFCLTHDLFNENEWNRYFANKKEFNKKNILDIYINERGYVLDMLFFTDKFKKYYFKPQIAIGILKSLSNGEDIYSELIVINGPDYYQLENIIQCIYSQNIWKILF